MRKLNAKVEFRFTKYFLLLALGIIFWNFSGAQITTDYKCILFTGDIFLGETYQEKLESQGKTNILKAKGYDYSFANLDSLLFRASTVIANLETPVTNMARSPLAGGDKYKLHRADADSTPSALKRHNISVVSLANNHALDFSEQGLEETMNVLKKNSVSFFGAGNNETESSAPYQFSNRIGKNIFHMVVMGGLDYDVKYDSNYSFYSSGNKPGVNKLSTERISEQIKNIRKKDAGAFIIVFPHWFENYVWKSEWQTKLAHAMIDAGADIVIGHGAHMLQEMEWYQNKWIIYSLGNFIFNSPGRYAKFSDVNPYSAAAMMKVSSKSEREIITIQLYPYLSDNLVTNYQPRLTNEKEFEVAQTLLFKHSPSADELRKKLKTGKDEIGYYMEINVRD